MWFCLLHHVHSPPLIALIAADQHPLTINFASERSAPFDRTTLLPCDLDGGKAASWRPKHLRIANGARAAPEEPANVQLPRKSVGIIPDVVRWRKSVGTTAVKSPEQMRDVAQI